MVGEESHLLFRGLVLGNVVENALQHPWSSVAPENLCHLADPDHISGAELHPVLDFHRRVVCLERRPRRSRLLAIILVQVVKPPVPVEPLLLGAAENSFDGGGDEVLLPGVGERDNEDDAGDLFNERPTLCLGSTKLVLEPFLLGDVVHDTLDDAGTLHPGKHRGALVANPYRLAVVGPYHPVFLHERLTAAAR